MEILKFDSALEVFYLNKDKAALGIKDIQRKLPFRLTGEEISMMLDKLRTDHLVSQQTGAEAAEYCITYEGIKFYQRGGYLKEKARLFANKALKIGLMLLGFASTVIGIMLGLRQLL